MSASFTPAQSAINLRLVVFIVLVSSPFVWCAYAGMKYAFNGGIEDHGAYKKVDLKALGKFNFDQSNGTISEVPERFRNLDGQRVTLEGFMYSPDRAQRVSDFQFVYNIQVCCFGGPPRVQERVFVFCPPGRMLMMDDRYMKMTGILHVQVKKVDGIITSVYTLDLQDARPA